jgi:hypothetical protein
MDRIDQRDQQREIYKVDLNRDSALPSTDAKFVQFTGTVQLDHQYLLETKEGSSVKTEAYIPLTGSDWTPKQPIRFFITRSISTSRYGGPVKVFGNFPEQGAAATTFDGKLNWSRLPTFVENDFRRDGLLVASPHYVVEETKFVDGRVPSSKPSEMILFFGFGLSLLFAFSLSLAVVIRKFRHAH